MFPTRLGMALCDKFELEKICLDDEQMVYCIRDCIADVQQMAAVGSPYEEVEMVFLTWLSVSPKSAKKGKLHRKMTAGHRAGLLKIMEVTKRQVNGQIIGMLAELTDSQVSDKERVAATQLLHSIMNGEDVEANAAEVSRLIVETVIKK